MKGDPPMKYLRCLEYKRTGCLARAVIPTDGTIQDIQVRKSHNHPPDFTAEEKIVFMRELKGILVNNPSINPVEVYRVLRQKYPNAAREMPYDIIKNKLQRWRRNSITELQKNVQN